jgi:diguanylate cyclase (GGDEF)-like protein
MIDLDHFKRVNDQNGHPGGDEVLRRAAEVMRNNTRASDLIGRVGGEEFLVILPETPLEKALNVAEQLRKKMEQMLVFHGGRKIVITISIGAAALQEGGDDAARLIFRSDQALYHAKNSGRNQVCVSSPGGDPAAVFQDEISTYVTHLVSK